MKYEIVVDTEELSDLGEEDLRPLEDFPENSVIHNQDLTLDEWMPAESGMRSGVLAHPVDDDSPPWLDTFYIPLENFKTLEDLVAWSTVNRAEANIVQHSGRAYLRIWYD